jgi:hypothetical protein
LPHAKGPVTIPWATALYRARLEICALHSTSGLPPSVMARERREWTLPIMYVGSAPFQLHPVRAVTADIPPSPLTREQRIELESELQILKGLVARDFGAPASAITSYQDQISRLEDQLAPSQ